VTASDTARIDSIRQRLLNHARASGVDFQLVLDRYAVERLLYRLSVSPYRNHFLLKGAMLFAIWFDVSHRPTRDADFLGLGPPDPGRLDVTVRALCSMELDDGLAFDLDTLSVAPIREAARYEGLRVSLRARLGHAVCMIQWDVGFGDTVTPCPDERTLPTLLDDQPAPHLRVYPRETAFAEKLEALAVLGIANSRMKDYFDLLTLAREDRMDADTLARAIAATFARRGTPLPRALPTGLSKEFALDEARQRQWTAFLSRHRLEAPPLPGVVAELGELVDTLLPNAHRLGGPDQ
jgi:predicted nucleotidyltransferase component of viral defense system